MELFVNPLASMETRPLNLSFHTDNCKTSSSSSNLKELAQKVKDWFISVKERFCAWWEHFFSSEPEYVRLDDSENERVSSTENEITSIISFNGLLSSCSVEQENRSR